MSQQDERDHAEEAYNRSLFRGAYDNYLEEVYGDNVLADEEDRTTAEVIAVRTGRVQPRRQAEEDTLRGIRRKMVSKRKQLRRRFRLDDDTKGSTI